MDWHEAAGVGDRFGASGMFLLSVQGQGGAYFWDVAGFQAAEPVLSCFMQLRRLQQSGVLDASQQRGSAVHRPCGATALASQADWLLPLQLQGRW